MVLRAPGTLYRPIAKFLHNFTIQQVRIMFLTIRTRVVSRLRSEKVVFAFEVLVELARMFLVTLLSLGLVHLVYAIFR